MTEKYIGIYGRRLYGLCLTLCRNKFDADDLYQETWLRVYSKADKYDPSLPFEPYLTGICVNAYRDILRKRKRTLAMLADGFDDKNIPDCNQPSDYSALRAAVDSLPQKMRVTVILFYFHDMDAAKVAKALGVPPGTVKSRLHRAKAILRKELADDD